MITMFDGQSRVNLRVNGKSVAAIDDNRGETRLQRLAKAVEVPLTRLLEELIAIVVRCRIVADMLVKIFVRLTNDAELAGQLARRVTFAATGQSTHQIDDFDHRPAVKVRKLQGAAGMRCNLRTNQDKRAAP